MALSIMSMLIDFLYFRCQHTKEGGLVESFKRSAVKTICYRTVSSFTTAAVAWVITGRLGLAVSVGVADSASKFAIYFLHERAWDRIDYGRPTEPEYQI